MRKKSMFFTALTCAALLSNGVLANDAIDAAIPYGEILPEGILLEETAETVCGEAVLSETDSIEETVPEDISGNDGKTTEALDKIKVKCNSELTLTPYGCLSSEGQITGKFITVTNVSDETVKVYFKTNTDESSDIVLKDESVLSSLGNGKKEAYVNLLRLTDRKKFLLYDDGMETKIGEIKPNKSLYFRVCGELSANADWVEGDSLKFGLVFMTEDETSNVKDLTVSGAAVGIDESISGSAIKTIEESAGGSAIKTIEESVSGSAINAENGIISGSAISAGDNAATSSAIKAEDDVASSAAIKAKLIAKKHSLTERARRLVAKLRKARIKLIRREYP